MKQVLLVDDDFLSLNTFYSLLDWGQLELHIAFEAHSGQEALDYLKSCEDLPAVAFIDVCMPDMDGISLLQILRSKYPDTICFMLSSHSDYPYVRETLKLGAADYMLKHEITPESIVSVLQTRGLIPPVCKVPVSPDQRLADALIGKTTFELCGFVLYGVYKDARPLLEVQRNSMIQTCRHLLNSVSGAAVCCPTSCSLVVALPAQTASAAADTDTPAIQMSVLLQRTLLKYHNVHFSFLKPCFCSCANELTACYRSLAEQAIHEEASFPSPNDMHAFFRPLSIAIASGSKARLSQVLQTLFQNNTSSSAELWNQLLDFLMQTRQVMGLPSINYNEVPCDDAETFLLKAFSPLCDERASHANARFSQSICNALQFIDDHYAEDIQLSDVACHCHISYTHLSYLFKKETGNNLIHYLTRVRVYHAARMLLCNGASVTEACQSSGFKSYNHFITIFKTISGMTPSEFRKNPNAVNWLLSFRTL